MAVCRIGSTAPHVAAVVEAVRIYAAALTLLAILAFSPAKSDPCAVVTSIHVSTYTGPVDLTGCMTGHGYGDGVLVVDARQIGDGLFKNGFDPEAM